MKTVLLIPSGEIQCQQLRSSYLLVHEEQDLKGLNALTWHKQGDLKSKYYSHSYLNLDLCYPWSDHDTRIEKSSNLTIFRRRLSQLCESCKSDRCFERLNFAFKRASCETRAMTIATLIERSNWLSEANNSLRLHVRSARKDTNVLRSV